jgi:hypothetical protein
MNLNCEASLRLAPLSSINLVELRCTVDAGTNAAGSKCKTERINVEGVLRRREGEDAIPLSKLFSLISETGKAVLGAFGLMFGRCKLPDA